MLTANVDKLNDDQLLILRVCLFYYANLLSAVKRELKKRGYTYDYHKRDYIKRQDMLDLAAINAALQAENEKLNEKIAKLQSGIEKMMTELNESK